MVLIFAESPDGILKKSAYEAVSYGRKAADLLGKECVALVLGDVANADQLGVYGAGKVLQVKDAGLQHFDSQVYAAVISEIAKAQGAELVILSDSSMGKSLLGRLAVQLHAGSVSGVNTLPSITDTAFTVQKNVFSGKAIAEYALHSPVKVLSLMGNAFPPEASGQVVTPEEITANVPESRITIQEVKKVEGSVPLPEAELVVSAGRGMKGPENWGIIEELATTLGAATACSRPVADDGWRPHHEHVGQTGVAIRPNLYIAIGISGAIQHLAGVNKSKVIVVINKDPEAPFFKAADYGVCADLFDVVPQLTKALQEFKA